MNRPAVRSLVCASVLVATVASRAAFADVFSRDPRAATLVSGRYVTAPTPSILAALAKQTGMRLAADGPAVDLPVTLIYHDRRASDVLASLAAFLDLTWVRSSEGYVLIQSPEQEARFRSALHEVLAPLPAALHAFATKKARYDPSDPLVNDVGRLGHKILRDIGTSGIAQLMEGDDPLFAWPAREGCLAIPESALREWRSEPVKLDPGGWDPRQAQSITVRCALALGYMTPNLTCEVRAQAYEYSDVAGRPTPRTAFGLAGGVDYGGYVAPIIARSGRRAGSEMPASMADVIAIELTDTVDPARSQIVTQLPRTYLLGDVLAELDRLKHIDVIADAFAAPQMFGVHIGARPMADALEELARMTTSEWWVEDGFLMMRHSQRALRRASEPPHYLLSALRDKLTRNAWTLDDSAALAMLPTPQYESIWFPANPPLLPHPTHLRRYERDALRLWASLTPAQKTMSEDKGVAYATLTTAQKALFRQFLNAIDGSYVAALQTVDASQTTGAVLRVTRHHGQAFRHRRGEWTISGVEREHALTSFRLQDASTTDADLIVGSSDYYWIRVTSGGKDLNSVSITLPTVWSE